MPQVVAARRRDRPVALARRPRLLGVRGRRGRPGGRTADGTRGYPRSRRAQRAHPVPADGGRPGPADHRRAAEPAEGGGAMTDDARVRRARRAPTTARASRASATGWPGSCRCSGSSRRTAMPASRPPRSRAGRGCRSARSTATSTRSRARCRSRCGATGASGASSRARSCRRSASRCPRRWPCSCPPGSSPATPTSTSRTSPRRSGRSARRCRTPCGSTSSGRWTTSPSGAWTPTSTAT